MIRRLLGAMLVVSLLSGCAIFSKPSAVTTIERQEAVNAWARAKILYGRAVTLAERACSTGQWSPVECAKAAQLHEQAKRLGAEVEAKLATPEAEIQWDRVMKLLELALDIVL